MAEALGRSLERGKGEGRIRGIAPATGVRKVTHHQFVDDTILIGEGTKREARNFRDLLRKYEKASNQEINIGKSSIYFVNTPNVVQEQIRRILEFRIQELPATYLGMPLFKGRMKNQDWDPLVAKIQKKLAGWKGACLSQAGKVLLLKTVLQSSPIYWMSLFEIPSRVAERIESIQKQFLWGGVEEKRRLALLKWEKVCLPKEEGGIGLRRIKDINKALLGKLSWRLISGELEPWKEILAGKYLGGGRNLQEGGCHQGSAIWKGIRGTKDLLEEGSRWQLGDGRRIDFWKDKWLEGQPLQLGMEEVAGKLREEHGSKVRDYIEGGRWKKIQGGGEDVEERIKEINHRLSEAYIPRYPRADRKVWGDNRTGEYTVKSGYNRVREQGGKEEIYQEIWRNKATPKTVIFVWLSARNKILTMDNLQRRGWSLPNRCILCKKEEESVNHLLVGCNYSREVWNLALEALQTQWVAPQEWKNFIMAWRSNIRSEGMTKLWEVTLAQTAWNLWKERNRRIFQEKERGVRSLWNLIYETIKENMGIIEVKTGKITKEEEEIRKRWKIPRGKSEEEDKRQGVQWIPPPEGWKKLNFDGAAKGNPGEAGGGGVLRNHKGEVEWAYASYFGRQTNHKAEMMAMSVGVKGCEIRNPGKVIIEGDSMNIIKILKGESVPDWRSEHMIKDLMEAIGRWEEVLIKHTYREGNRVADLLANMGVTSKENMEWQGSIPMEVQKLAQEDMRHPS